MKLFRDPKKFQHVLGIAGVLNIVGGMLFLFYGNLFFLLFFKKEVIADGVSAPAALLSINLWSFILLMGFGNLWASKNPVRNKLFVLIGAAGKFAAAMAWFYAYSSGIGTPLLLVAAVTDLILAGFFFTFVYLHRDQ